MKNKLRAVRKYLRLLEASSRDEQSLKIRENERIYLFEQLLEKSRQLETTQKITPRAQFVEASKDRIFNKLVASQNLTARRISATPQKKHAVRSFVASPAFSIFLILILGFGFVGSVQAANSALPGDLLYTADLSIEQARFQLALTDYERAELYLDFACERLEEAQTKLAIGDLPNVKIALANYEHHLKAVRNLILNADDKIQSKLIQIVSTHNASQVQALESMFTTATIDLYDALLHAMSAADHVILAIEELPEALGIDLVTSSFLKFSSDSLENLKYVDGIYNIDTEGGTPDSANGDWLPPGQIDNPGQDDKELPPGLKDKEKPPGLDDKDKEKDKGN